MLQARLYIDQSHLPLQMIYPIYDTSQLQNSICNIYLSIKYASHFHLLILEAHFIIITSQRFLGYKNYDYTIRK